MPVYKDKKSGLWFIRINLNSKQYTRRGYKTKRDALNDELSFRNECTPATKKKKEIVITFDYLKKKYYSYRKNNLKPTSYYNLVQRIEKHICPSFDFGVNVKELTQHDFDRLRNNLSNSSLQDKNRIIRLLQDMFNYLDTYFEISIPYAKRLQTFKDYTPKIIDSDPINKPVEFDLFRQYYLASNNYFKFYLLTTYVFGLRISELRGVKIESFNFDKKLLLIRRVTTSKCGLKKSIDLIPKSKSSDRKYCLADLYLKMLNRFIEDNELNSSNRLFFTKKSKDKPISESSIRRYLDLISEANNLSHITPHGLRHGIATYLHSKGIPYEDIGKYLGHKFNNVTMDVYIDLTWEQQSKIINEIDNLISNLEA